MFPGKMKSMTHLCFICTVVLVTLFFTAVQAVAMESSQYAEIPLENHAALDRLLELEISVASIVRDTARVYLRQGEADRIRAAGFQLLAKPDPVQEVFRSLENRSDWQRDELDEYHGNDAIAGFILELQDERPELFRVSSAGSSFEGRELWVLEISDNVQENEDEPEVVLISTMHGNEPVGTEMLLMFAQLVADEYDENTSLRQLVDETHITLMPMMNPDGNEAGQRYNAQGFDLNREFPDRLDDPYNVPEGHPKEVQVLMQFFQENSFSLGANMHTGALVANYPYDGNPEDQSVYTACPDDAWYVDVCLTYSMLNPPMYNSTEFENGITNGADWYTINGGMQDWSYVMMGCPHITLELSDTFWPPENQLEQYWDENRDAIISFIEQAHRGIRGIVTDAVTGQPLQARIRVGENPIEVYTDGEVGDYHRLLLPGTYDLIVEADGYLPYREEGVLVSRGGSTRVDVQLVARPDGEFHEEFTDGVGGFIHRPEETGGADQWHLSDQHYFSAPQAFKCGDEGEGNYGTNMDASLITPPITVEDGSTLHFWHRIFSEASAAYYGYAYDGGRIEYHYTEGDTTWQVLTPEGGYPYLVRNTGDHPFPHDSGILAGYCEGRELHVPLEGIEGEVEFRFRFVSDNTVQYQGWFIDDVSVSGPSGTPYLIATPQTVAFDTLLVGASSSTSLTLRIIGDGDVIIDEALIQPVGGAFQITEDLEGMVLEPMSLHECELIFAPADSGTHLGELQINSNAPPLLVSLSGTAQQPSGLEDGPALPGEVVFQPPMPNPFNASTMLRFSLPAPSSVHLRVFDLLGREALTIAREKLPAGHHRIALDGSRLASGVYFVRLDTGSERFVRRVVLLR